MYKRIGRLYRTLRTLRPIQIYGRLFFKFVHPKPNFDPPPSTSNVDHSFITAAKRTASLIGPTNFAIHESKCDISKLGWDNPAFSKLFCYNLHYFDDLNAKNSIDRNEWHYALIDRWIAENPPGSNIGWDPYPTSLRIVNWIKWLLQGNVPNYQANASLAVQARWLTQKIEWHLMGNHLFVNAKALIFAGLFFDGDEANQWLKMGLNILSREIPEQILPDGGQFELSPMYHALALEDMLDIINLAKCFEKRISKSQRLIFEAVYRNIPNMLSWLRVMSHPDGEISFFNDSAFGVAPDNSELFSYANRLDFRDYPEILSPIKFLKDSGYMRLENFSAVVLADVASVGPDYLPAHAHADTLSFEMSLHGVRLIVNSGTSVYEIGPERSWQRSTAAHSTLCLNNKNSTEVWAAFRVGQRAKVSNIVTKKNTNKLLLCAQHNGYSYLPGAPIHQRKWELKDSCITVTDTLLGKVAQNVTIYFYLASGITVEKINVDTVQLCAVNGTKLGNFKVSSPGMLQIDTGTWYPRFGQKKPNIVLKVLVNAVPPFSVQSVISWRQP